MRDVEVGGYLESRRDEIRRPLPGMAARAPLIDLYERRLSELRERLRSLESARIANAAATNRALLGALVDESWLGARLLAPLDESITASDLATLVGESVDGVAVALARLHRGGAVDAESGLLAHRTRDGDGDTAAANHRRRLDRRVMPGAFAKKQQKLEKRLREQELAVLVWGSASGEHYEKRQKIRKALEEHFSKSEVRFSEDLTYLVPSAGDAGIGQQEEYQLALSDACVVLDTSAGPAGEIAYFARSPLKHKLIVFTHDRHKGSKSFPAQLREVLEHHFYSDAEYASCSLVERVCDRMRYVALGKLLGVSPV